jgi:hypothetical protein
MIKCEHCHRPIVKPAISAPYVHFRTDSVYCNKAKPDETRKATPEIAKEQPDD